MIGMLESAFRRTEEAIINILSRGVELTESFILTYGITALIVASLARGFMLFWIAPDEVVTVSYVLFYSETLFHVLGIVLISTIFILIANSLVFLFFRWVGEEFISEEKKMTRTWRFLNWAFDRNGKFSIIIFRLTPMIGGDWVAIFSGITEMKIKSFLFYSFIGILLHETMLGMGAFYGLEKGLLYEMEIPFIQFLIEWIEAALS